MDSKLSAQRANIRKFIAYCEAVINMPEPNISKGYLEAKSKIITEFWVKLDNGNDSLIEEYDEDDRANDYFAKKEFDVAFQMYDKVCVRIHSKLEKFEKVAQLGPVQLPDNVVFNAGEGSKLKLKPIDIPKFSGDYGKWLSFKSLYESLVHNSAKFENLEKIHYLKSCLSGEAERIISQFDTTAEAYPAAYKAITERFHNEVILVDTHIISILSQPDLKRESSEGIKELMDGTTQHLRALKTLQIDVTTWDPILLLLLVQKLDHSTRRLWEQTLKPKTRPTMAEFLEFLEARFHALGCQRKFNFAIDQSSNIKTQYRQKKSFQGGTGFQNSSGRRSENTFNGEVFPPNSPQNFFNATKTSRKCPFQCDEPHEASKCDRFLKSVTRSRYDWVACAKLCKNCLQSHKGRCDLKPGCQNCGKYHHTLLHLSPQDSAVLKRNTLPVSKTEPQSRPVSGQTQIEKQLNAHHFHLQQKGGGTIALQSNLSPDCIAWNEPVLLATAIVLIRSTRDNMFYPFRALLDQASEASYVSENVVQILGLKKISIFASTTGLGGTTTGSLKAVVDFELGSKRNQQFSIKVQAPVVSKVTNLLPSTKLQQIEWEHIRGLPLADPEFNVPGKIDILLGAPVYGCLLLPGLKRMSQNAPVAQNTEFGWILSGGTREPASLKQSISTFHLKLDVDDQLKKFFEQEEISKERIFTKEEVECEEFFKKTHRRNEEGRFVVALPFKGDPNSLGSSKGQAKSRLMKLEDRFASNKELKEDYTAILKEYEDLNHTSVVGKLNSQLETCRYYLPHHAVFKPESTTTKTRVVFDASAKSTNGTSLNELLMAGPNLQRSLISILLSWRSYRYIFSADIAKMFRQLLIRPEDRKYLRFLFRECDKEDIQEYEHNMVIFGLKPASYLAVKALHQLATEQSKNFPRASEVILNDFYMDDGMSGSHTVEEGIKLCKELKELLARGKFELRKFISNSNEILESIPEKDRELKLPLEINIDSNIKTLGIRYHPTTDKFQFKVNLETTSEWPTKKSLLSETARLFDPLGWLAPVVIRAKILFQNLWQEGLNWDQKLPDHIAKTWLEFRSNLHLIEDIEIERWIGMEEDTDIFELHGFCDASILAYAAVIFARILKKDGSVQITNLTSKTRVAPIKQITLPRLELCGAVLLANLMEVVQGALKVKTENIHVWTDSTVVLGWLRTEPAKLKTFVANRVVEAHNVLNVNQWHHIEGVNNPADCASRGIGPEELRNNKLWWKGPEILSQDRSSWHQDIVIPPATSELKTKILSAFVITASDEFELLVARYSSFRRLVKIIAICLKFIDNLQATKSARIATLCLTFINKVRAKAQRVQLIITAEELRKAEIHIIRLSQGKDFFREIHHLANKRPINNKSKILSLNPFLDKDGCLRVGGRLKEANLTYDRKHPFILLPGGISNLIIMDMHKRSLHGGTQLTMNLVRESYWIINLRRQVRKYILSCVKCCRFKQSSSSQIMADLPKPRVNESVSFTHTGLDYAGPYNIKASNVKSPPTRIKPIVVNGEVIKSIPKVPVYEGYIALFVCLATRAIHLEVVSDMTTDAFLAAFDRFTSNRGIPECCYSDNAKTFIGAKNVLDMEHEKSLLNYKTVAAHLADGGINWKFIPPRAPHQGGIWESGVKSMKHHLRRIIGNTILTFEELSTVLAKVEACLNSRPMCPLTDNPEDLSVLTPGHFLIGKPLLARPIGKSNPKSVGLKERWNMVQRIQRDFWHAWSLDYLNQLQNRQKWTVQRTNLKEGDIVLSKEQNMPPTKWPLARIVRIHPATDRNVRSVTIKFISTSGKMVELVRPIVNLCLLPITDNFDDEDDPSNQRVSSQ